MYCEVQIWQSGHPVGNKCAQAAEATFLCVKSSPRIWPGLSMGTRVILNTVRAYHKQFVTAAYKLCHL